MLSRIAAVVAALGLILSGVGIACGAIDDEAPARNPLAETASTSTPLPTATPAVLATGTPPAPPARGEVTPPPAAQAELVIARALELLAEWLSVPQRELSVSAAEPVVWPDACLGVRQPIACAQVVTPGFRLKFQDALGAKHTVHADATSARALWAGEAVAAGTVTAVDSGARRVTVEVEGKPLLLRLVPGTRWIPANAEPTAAGHRVAVGYDPAGNASLPSTAAWLVLDPP